MPNIIFQLVGGLGKVMGAMSIPFPEADPMTDGVILPGSALGEVLWLRPRLLWSLGRNGESVWVTRSDSLNLTEISLSGDTLHQVVSTHRFGRFTSAQRHAIRRANQELGRTASFVPLLVQGVHALEDGKVLAQIGDDMNVPGQTVDVFGPEGVWLGTLSPEIPINHRSELASRGDTLLYVGVGAFDTPVVVKAVLEQQARPEGRCRNTPT
jgi:hypothetical protein